MKIGIDSRMYGSKITGIGNYVKNLTDQLFEIDKTNQYLMFMRSLDFENFVPPSNVKKIKVEIPWYSWSEQLKYFRILEKQKLDLFHFPHFNVPLLYTRKFVVTIHDITPYFFPGSKVIKSKLRKIAYETVFKSTLKRAEIIITVSQHTKENLIKYFKTDPKEIKVIYEGISQEFKIISNYEKINQFKSKYQITKPFIFYVGVWRDHKNLEGLIKAFAILKNNYRLNCQLVLGGQEDKRYPQIRRTWQNLNLEVGKDIILPGFISGEELPLFYNAAEIFVLPSFSEGFGLVALEAMACGTSVVGSETTSLPEVLGDAALYFDPYQEIEIAKTVKKLLTNHNLKQELIKKGLEKVKEYSWRKCAEETLRVYQKAME